MSDDHDDRTVVECVDVRKSFGDHDVLRGVDLVVGRGELVALSGPSGSGKSTLLHLLAALDRPSSGRIVVAGHDLARLRMVNRYRRTDVGVVFQLHNLLPHMTAERNVEMAMFGTGRSASERSARAALLLDQVDLSHAIGRSPTRLSGGERQRVAIARAVANEPRVLLADEPTGSLDPDSSEVVLEVLDRLRATLGTAIVMVTHDPAVALRADARLRLEDGRLTPV
jgi:putative ABC transport system ATP-binding protein